MLFLVYYAGKTHGQYASKTHGQQLKCRNSMTPPPLSTDDHNTEIAWRSNMTVFTCIPFDEVIEVRNCLSPPHLIITNEQLPSYVATTIILIDDITGYCPAADIITDVTADFNPLYPALVSTIY